MCRVGKIFLFGCVLLVVLNIVLWLIMFMPHSGRVVAIKPTWSMTLGQWIDRGTILTVENRDCVYCCPDDQNEGWYMSIVSLYEVPGEWFREGFFRRATIIDEWIARRFKKAPLAPAPPESKIYHANL